MRTHPETLLDARRAGPMPSKNPSPSCEQRLIGLIGGMSYHSSALYYSSINQIMEKRRGAHRNGASILYSLDFASLLETADKEGWCAAAKIISQAAKSLEAAGAEVIALTALTAHMVADQVAETLRCPLLHVADAVGQAALRSCYRHVGLMGTLPVTSQPFIRARLERFGLSVSAPGEVPRQLLHGIIIDELTLGIMRDDSKRRISEVAADLRNKGCEAIVLGCTELPLIINTADLNIPVLDAMQIHSEAIVDASLATFQKDSLP